VSSEDAERRVALLVSSADAERRVALLVGLGAAALLFGLLLVAQPLLRTFLDRPLPSGRPTEREAEVDLWVGEVAPGVKGILGAVYDDPEADARNDREWNAGLGLPGDQGLAYYRLHLANTSPDPVRVDLHDGLLTITPPDGTPVRMRSLSSLIAEGRVSPSLRASLSALGSGREALDVPAGTLAAPFVAFPRRVALGQASAVAREDGVSFHRRRIPRDRWEDLRASPSARRIEEL
jgi:hypothetical protein